MKSPPISHAVPVSTRHNWRSFDHHLLNRRISGSRAARRHTHKADRRVRDAIEMTRGGRYGVRLVVRIAIIGLAALAVTDLINDAPPVHLATLIGAVVLAGAASLLAIVAAEPE